MKETAKYESWESFLEAVDSDPLSEEQAIVVEYDSSFSDDPQRIQGRVRRFNDSALARPFVVESSTDDHEVMVKGWHVYSSGTGGRKIGRVNYIKVSQ